MIITIIIMTLLLNSYDHRTLYEITTVKSEHVTHIRINNEVWLRTISCYCVIVMIRKRTLFNYAICTLRRGEYDERESDANQIVRSLTLYVREIYIYIARTVRRHECECVRLYTESWVRIARKLGLLDLTGERLGENSTPSVSAFCTHIGTNALTE